MSNVLQEICQKKQCDVDERKAIKSFGAVKAEALSLCADGGEGQACNKQACRFLRSLEQKVSDGKPALIAEVKKASPSKGLIRADFSPEDIAESYERAGAACLSVLTEERYFQGHDQYLQDVTRGCDLPVLRKDFTVDAYQIYEAKILGASCILLIVAALSDSDLIHFHELAYELDMGVLVEVHDRQELERALRIPSLKILGVNNRNLKTLNVDLQTSFDLVDLIPDDVFKISESGISQKNHVESLMSKGFQGFLIGEHFMRQSDIENAVCSLIDL